MDPNVLKHLLKDIDEEFSNDAQDTGIEAWENRLADDAIMMTEGLHANVEGKENILKSLGGLYSLDDLHFSWKPLYAAVSDDATLGYTAGYYIRTYKQDGKEIKHSGTYTTVWKYIDEQWKIISDIGNTEEE